MINERVTVEILGRKHVIEMEGVTPLEIQMFAQQVDERMRSIGKVTGVVDSSRLAVLTALEFASELHKAKQHMEDLGRLEAKKIDEMQVALNTAIGSEGKAS